MPILFKRKRTKHGKSASFVWYPTISKWLPVTRRAMQWEIGTISPPPPQQKILKKRRERRSWYKSNCRVACEKSRFWTFFWLVRRQSWVNTVLWLVLMNLAHLNFLVFVVTIIIMLPLMASKICVCSEDQFSKALTEALAGIWNPHKENVSDDWSVWTKTCWRSSQQALERALSISSSLKCWSIWTKQAQNS